MKSQEFPVSYLLDQRKIFNNYPDYQREQVWKTGRKQLLINAILSGLPVPPLIARKLLRDEGTIYELIDGQQRFKTLCDFRDGYFNTATVTQMRRLEPLWGVIDPGKSYSELLAESRHFFNDFTLLLYSSDDIDIATGAQIYRNLQRGQQLTGGQKLKSYYSTVNTIARELSNHSFWHEIYDGATIGGERLRGSLHVLIMELARDYAPQRSRDLRDYACGLKDGLVNENTLPTCVIHLDMLSFLFSQVQIHQSYEVIPLYQAVLFLEKAGYVLEHLERGYFTSWFKNVQQKAYRIRYQGGGSPLAGLAHMEAQRYFWEEHFPQLEHMVQRIGSSAV